MRILLEILGLRTPERGREPVALPRSIRWIVPFAVVAGAAVGILIVRVTGELAWALISQ